MEKLSLNLPNKNSHNLGNDTRHLVITADESDDRAWLSNRMVCPLLKQHHMTHMGIMYGQYPLEIVRASQDGSYFMACTKGKGEVIIDGSWKVVKEGEACLLPPITLNAFRCIEGYPWEFSWVRYNELRSRMPISSLLSPTKSKYNYTPITKAIEGMYSELQGKAQPAMLNLWNELVHQYVAQFAKDDSMDERLWKLWKTVEANLGRHWTLQELARNACVSEEHLRRLCNKSLGRSPMQQLTYLRMQKARFLLGTTSEKIESIAKKLGYENPFTFSNTFKKWVGWRPSEVR